MALWHAAFKLFPEQSNAAHPLFDIRTSATDYAKLLMMEVNYYDANGGTAPALRLGTPASAGTARPSQIALVGDSELEQPAITINTDWTAKPTAPTTFYRAWTRVASGTTLFRAQFYDGLKIAPSSTLVLWNASAPTILSIQLMVVNLEFEA